MRLPRMLDAEVNAKAGNTDLGTRVLMTRLFGEIGVSPKIGMEIGSNETIKQAVMAGLGIALISAHTVASEVQDGRLSVLEVEGFPVIRTWFVIKLSERRLLPAAQALWDFLYSEGVRFLPETSGMFRRSKSGA